MQIELNEEQVKSLEASCSAFNRFTGKRWSLQKYISFVIADAVAGESRAATYTDRLVNPIAQTAGNHVH